MAVKLYKVPGRGLVWFDTADPENPENQAKAKAKAVKPKNKAVKPATK